MRCARAIRDAGLRVVDDEPLAGYDRVYADDPFGNRIEFMEPLDADHLPSRASLGHPQNRQD